MITCCGMTGYHGSRLERPKPSNLIRYYRLWDEILIFEFQFPVFKAFVPLTVDIFNQPFAVADESEIDVTIQFHGIYPASCTNSS